MVDCKINYLTGDVRQGAMRYETADAPPRVYFFRVAVTYHGIAALKFMTDPYPPRSDVTIPPGFELHEGEWDAWHVVPPARDNMSFTFAQIGSYCLMFEGKAILTIAPEKTQKIEAAGNARVTAIPPEGCCDSSSDEEEAH
jgi:hypothetical protein